MSSPDLIPPSGYRLEKVSALTLEYRVVSPEDEAISADQRETTLFWDWRITGAESFEVYIRGTVGANTENLEHVQAALLGEFSFREARSVTIDNFIRVHAPAILLPFVRETIASLTGRGPYSAYYLPAVNVVELAKLYEFAKSSGARQLQADPGLADRLGISPSVLATEARDDTD